MIWRCRFSILTVLAVFLSIGPTIVHAHPFEYGAINIQLTSHEKTIEATVTTPEILSKTPETKRNHWEHMFNTSLTISNNSASCIFSAESLRFESTETQTVFSGTYTCSEVVTDIAHLRIQTFLFLDFYEQMKTYLAVTIGDSTSHIIFPKGKTHYPEEVGLESYSSQLFNTFSAFVYYGITHIVLGYDHVLFLISLLVGIASLRTALITASVFALAHSVTLFLTLYGIVSISPAIVEPAIALTIAGVALVTIYRFWSGSAAFLDSWRVHIVFVLGLIHGLGFAGSLSETPIPQDQFLTALLSFTAGLEIGQLCIIACIFPLLLILQKRTRYTPYAIAVLSLIICIASVWFVQRVV